MDTMKRIPTHVEGLDENMQGGIPKGHICIVAGASGAMKSSVTFSVLYNAVLYGENKRNLRDPRARKGFPSCSHVKHGHETSMTHVSETELQLSIYLTFVFNWMNKE